MQCESNLQVQESVERERESKGEELATHKRDECNGK